MVKRKKKWFRMKEQVIHTAKSLRDSKYSQLILFFLILFICSGTLIFVFELNKNEEFSKFFDGLWWAIITFSTTGYGDKVPITAAGRITAVMSILFGVAAMSVLSGTLASLFVDRNTKARRGLMDFPKLQDHFIICGWK